jgi:Resolvase, N terminal domain
MAAGQRPANYERGSTARQGASGLGLEAQRKLIDDFAVSRGAEVLARFTELGSGRKVDRPDLAKAATCQDHGIDVGHREAGLAFADRCLSPGPAG